MKCSTNMRILIVMFAVYLLVLSNGLGYCKDTLSSGLFINHGVSTHSVRSAFHSVDLEKDSEIYPSKALSDVELILDDGTMENNIGIGGNAAIIWLNRFTPDPSDFPFNLNSISVFFSKVEGMSVGDEILLVVYENTAGNVDPAVGSDFLVSFPQTVQILNDWNDYDISGTPVYFGGPGDVLIGVIAMETPGTEYFPAAQDQDSTKERSWAGWWKTQQPPDPPLLPPNANWTLIDDVGATFKGNWLVRGYGDHTSSQPTNTPTEPPEPTVTPTPTYTPIPTNTPSPTPSYPLGVRLDMPEMAHPGDEFSIIGYLDNPDEPLIDVATFFILEVYGKFWFWPSWALFDYPEHADIDFRNINVPTGTTEVIVIPSFDWPDTGQDIVTGLGFFGAMLNQEMDDIMGGFAFKEWGYGP